MIVQDRNRAPQKLSSTVLNQTYWSEQPNPGMSVPTWTSQPVVTGPCHLAPPLHPRSLIHTLSRFSGWLCAPRVCDVLYIVYGIMHDVFVIVSDILHTSLYHETCLHIRIHIMCDIYIVYDATVMSSSPRSHWRCVWEDAVTTKDPTGSTPNTYLQLGEQLDQWQCAF